MASIPGVLANLSTGWMLERSGGSYTGPLRLTVLIYVSPTAPKRFACWEPGCLNLPPPPPRPPLPQALALVPFLVFASGRPVFR